MINIICPKPMVSLPKLHTIVLGLLKEEEKGKILDAPAGEGALSKELMHIGFDVYACDINASQFQLQNINFENVDMNKELPYETETFDYITCVEGIEHLENPWHLIREFSRVLKKDGKLIITTPNISSLYSRALFFTRGTFFLFDQDTFDRSDHINPLFFPELKLILTKNNFKIMKVVNDTKIRKKRFGEQMLYYSIYFFEEVFNIFLCAIELIHKILNKILKQNKKLSSFDRNKVILNKDMQESSILIIKAIKTNS